MAQIFQVRNSVEMYTVDNKSANHDPKTDENRIKGKRFNCLLSTFSENRIKYSLGF